MKPQIIIITDYDAIGRKHMLAKAGKEEKKDKEYFALSMEEAAGAPLPKEKPRKHEEPNVQGDSLDRLLGMMGDMQ